MNSNSLNLALRQTARSLSIPLELVEKIYYSYWSFIKQTASSLPLKEGVEEELPEPTNFNIPYIGKLYVDYDKVHKYNNQLKFYQNVKSKKD